MPNHRLNKSVPELFTIQNNLLNCRELSKNLPANSSTRCNANKHYAFIEKDKPKEEDKQQKPKADKPKPQSQAQPQFQPQPQYQPQPQPQSQKNPPAPPSVTQEITETLNQYGLGHIVPALSLSPNVNISAADEDNNTDSTFMKVAKNHVKTHTQKNLDDFVEYHELTREEIQAARMTKASYINLTEGSHASNAYAHSLIDGWKIDHELSNEHATTFVDKQGNVRIAYRGTQHGLFKGQDWVTNRKMAFGIEDEAIQIQEIEQHYEKVIEKYATETNPKPVKLLHGHSKGGGQAIIMGERKGINTITQDPALTPKMIATARQQHIINRTPTDYVSALSYIAELTNSKNFIHRRIKSQTGTGVLGAHDIRNMTDYDYKPVKGMGNTEYNPEVKNKAFVAKHLQDGKTIDEIQSMTGHEEGSQEHDRLSEHYNAVKDLNHNEVMSEAGYSTRPQSTPQQLMSKISEQVVSTIEGKTSAVARAVTTMTSRSSLAGLGAALATTYGLEELNIDPNQAEMVGGGIGNVVGDIVQNSNRQTARSVLARTATQNVSRATLTGLKSFARGGVGSGLGIVVEAGSEQVLDAIGVHGDVNTYASAALGGAAAGAIFGPEGAAIGAAVSVAAVSVEKIYDWWFNHDREFKPTEAQWQSIEEQILEIKDHADMRHAKENHAIFTDRHGVSHDYSETVVDLIDADSQFQELMIAQPQNIYAMNERIRQIVINHYHWRTSTRNLIDGDAEGLPQITPDGQWSMMRYSESNPVPMPTETHARLEAEAAVEARAAVLEAEHRSRATTVAEMANFLAEETSPVPANAEAERRSQQIANAEAERRSQQRATNEAEMAHFLAEEDP